MRKYNGIPLEMTFWSKVNIRESEECWPFQGHLTKKGYGGCGRRGRAHRVAWELTYGPIPNGLHVLHKCDNPSCCNPRHLFLGTSLDNSRDMVNKGRSSRGDKHYSRIHPERASRGEVISKFKETDIRKIRAMKDVSRKIIAKRFHISPAQISRILNGKTWKWLL